MNQPRFDIDHVKSYTIGSPLTSFTWSPTSYSKRVDDAFETRLSFAASFQDRSISMYENDTTYLFTWKHTDFINQISIDYQSGIYLASASGMNIELLRPILIGL